MEFMEGPFCGIPVDTGIGDGHSEFQVGVVPGNFLAAWVEVAFQHHPDNGFAACLNLFCHGIEHFGLVFMVLATIGVGAIDHDGLDKVVLLEALFILGDLIGMVVGSG